MSPPSLTGVTESVAIFERGLLLYPLHGPINANLGKAYLLLAEEEVRKRNLELARSLTRQGVARLRAAVQEGSLAIEKVWLHAYHNLGIALLALQDPQAAIEALTVARTRAPDRSFMACEIDTQIAKAMIFQEDYTGGSRLLQKVLTVDADHDEAFQMTLDVVQKVANTHAHRPRNHIILARLHYHKERLPESFEAFSNALIPVPPSEPEGAHLVQCERSVIQTLQALQLPSIYASDRHITEVREGFLRKIAALVANPEVHFSYPPALDGANKHKHCDVMPLIFLLCYHGRPVKEYVQVEQLT